MRHHVAGKKLGRTTAHKIAMFRNMVTSLIMNDRIETTLPKAKELRRWADKMITLAKKNTVASRRQAMTVLRDKAALQKLFSDLVDRFKDRAGGYTRVLKLGFRHGDNAPMAVIEYLTAEIKKVQTSGKKSSKASAKKSPPKGKAKPVAEKKTKTAKKAAPKSDAKKTVTKAKSAAKKKTTKKESGK
jgi:large subunit ribosomal protein L17